MTSYDPDGIGLDNGNIFSLQHSFDEATIILIPVPWEVTTSYSDGTSKGPSSVLQASRQLDLIDPVFGRFIWEDGVHLLPVNTNWLETNEKLRPEAKECTNWMVGHPHGSITVEIQNKLDRINMSCANLHHEVYLKTREVLDAGKFAGVIGGEHSVALGIIKAISENYDEFGILQIDAHADLRESYTGYMHSHASIMHKALQFKNLKCLSQVALRDVSPGELSMMQAEDRIISFFDSDLKLRLFNGETWNAISEEIIKKLPENVYISFDIDGLQPGLCPNTGTPVPGGLEFWEAVHLLRLLKSSGRRIIGFDLCEVSPGNDMQDEWDGNVGARILFYLCNALSASHD